MGGKRKLFVYYFVICLYETYCSSFDVSQLSLDEIDSMFGEDGCIEGININVVYVLFCNNILIYKLTNHMMVMLLFTN